MAKLSLHSDDSIFDFVLLGISSQENQYVLVSVINDFLNIELELNRFIPLILKSSDLFEFSQYRYIDENHALEYYFLPNRSNHRNERKKPQTSDLFSEIKHSIDESVLLIPELKQTDFFILIKGEKAEYYKTKLFELLKSTPYIDTVHEIIPEKLASRNNLVF
ncbi:MAG: IPExxxVDY family protein [Bacteroidia bacterium]